MKCLMCEKEIGLRGFGFHLKKTHGICLKEYYNSYLRKENEGVCIVCGKETNFHNLETGYFKYCSVKCSASSGETHEKQKNTCIEKYGVEHAFKNKEIQEKQKKTCLERYGVEHPTQSDIIKEKIKQTNLERYGVENISQNEEIHKKILRTNLNHYGVENISQSDIIKEKIKQTNLERYGVENIAKNTYIKEKIKKTCNERYGVSHFSKSVKFHIKCFENLKRRLSENDLNILNRISVTIDNPKINLKCIKCFNCFSYSYTTIIGYLNNNIKICPYCNPRDNGVSNAEKELVDYIKSIYDGEIVENDRNVLNGQELDIYLPEKKLAFEYNGLYWHSSEYKDKDYHYNKNIACYEKGIKLIHIWEHEWVENKSDIKKKILNMLNTFLLLETPNEPELKIIHFNEKDYEIWM